MTGPENAQKRILITGGTSGLGLELVKILAKDGAEIYATGREKRNDFPENEHIHFVKTDFADLKQVRQSVNDLLANKLKIDIVVNNAGVLSPASFTLTPDGYEYTFQVNFLSHLLIDDMILTAREENDHLTVFSVTSPVYKYVRQGFRIPSEDDYHSFRNYAETKLYLLILGRYLERKHHNLKYIGFNPGTFSSGIYRMQAKWFGRMYRIAAPFMRSPSKVASSLAALIQDKTIQDFRIYHYCRHRSVEIMELSVESEKFLLACHEALMKNSDAF